MHSLFEYNVGMKKNQKQYTIRGISDALDKQIRKLALKHDQSLNAWVLEILKRHVGLNAEGPIYHDLDPLCGQWSDDPQTTEALREQRRIDKKLWK